MYLFKIHDKLRKICAMKTFGENLKDTRSAMKMKQDALAKEIGTSQQHVSKWEQNKSEPTLSFILKLTKALDTTFDDLTDGVAPKD